MPEEPCVVGVDFGTLSGRAVVVRVRDGAELASAEHVYPHAVLDRELPDGTRLPRDWALQVPSHYVDVLCNAVPEALARAGGARPRSHHTCSQPAARSWRPSTGHFSFSPTAPLKPSPKFVATPGRHDHPGRFHVTFKMLKHQMYGPAGFQLLRKRVLCTP